MSEPFGTEAPHPRPVVERLSDNFARRLSSLEFGHVDGAFLVDCEEIDAGAAFGDNLAAKQHERSEAKNLDVAGNKLFEASFGIYARRDQRSRLIRVDPPQAHLKGHGVILRPWERGPG